MENNKLESTNVEFQYGNQVVKLETNKVARQATSAVMVTIGDLVVLTTVVAKNESDPSKDFFPLAVFIKKNFMQQGEFQEVFLKEKQDQLKEKPLHRDLLTDQSDQCFQIILQMKYRFFVQLCHLIKNKIPILPQ